MPKLLLATTNQGKAREYRHLLKGLPFEMVTPAEEGIDISVDEKNTSLEENARLKPHGTPVPRNDERRGDVSLII